jgi:hypothetical protein
MSVIGATRRGAEDLAHRALPPLNGIACVAGAQCRDGRQWLIFQVRETLRNAAAYAMA